MDEKTYTYKAMETSFTQGNLDTRLTAQLFHYSCNDCEWNFTIWDSQQKKEVYQGDLQQTIELILLGQTYKAQLAKEAKSA